MGKIVVSLVTMGSLKYPVDVSKLVEWKSDLISIVHGASVGHLPNADGDDWERSRIQLRKLVKPDQAASFTLGLINSPLEDNYYLRRLENNVAVLSLYEMAEIVHHEDFKIEDFILRNIYELAVLYEANSGKIPADGSSWTHDDIRHCLFDMNSNKADIVFSLNQPKLCEACTTRVKAKQIRADFLTTLTNELKRLRKSRYYRWTAWVRAHPVWALVITGCTAVLLNLVASIIFESIKPYMTWLK